ncbi:MAG: hypothetical protein J0H74_23630 [Chitinophagaceae bacterium]|nr:hypothetical protein [Chitinophagaceae bacterium]
MRAVFWTMAICWWHSGFGQLSVSLQGPPAGVIQQSGLWNMALINSGASTLEVTISLNLVDNSTNQPVLTATTQPVLLTRGVRQLKPMDISSVSYSYLSPAFARLGTGNGLLPVGNYRACYTFYTFHGERHMEVVLAEECIPVEVQPLSPPQLSLPADTAVVETPYPQFSWLPPVPMNLFSDLKYDLLVTEVQAGQTPQSAIQENLPIYSGLNLAQAFHSYAASYKGLDTGKVYAWRVVAKNGQAFAAQSEVWTFRLGKLPVPPLAPANGTYLELKGNSTAIGTGILPNNILGLQYYSYDKTHETEIRLTDEKGATLQTLRRTLQYGNNLIVVALGGAFKPGATYFAEVSDLQKNLYRTSFRMAQ